jgi:hypothetical protein
MNKSIFRFLLVAGLVIAFAGPSGFAGEKRSAEKVKTAAPLASINSFEGEVTIKAVKAKEAILPEIDQELSTGDEITTGADGHVEILLSDRSIIKIDNNSRMIVGQLGEKESRIKLLLGRCLAVIEHLVDKPVHFSVETSNAIAAVKGTEFVISTGKDGDEVTVVDGIVKVNSVGDKSEGVDVNKDEDIQVKPGQKPSRMLRERETDKTKLESNASSTSGSFFATLGQMRTAAADIRKMQEAGELDNLRAMRKAVVRNEVLQWFRKNPDALEKMTPEQKINLMKYLKTKELTPEEKEAIREFGKKHPLLLEKAIRQQQLILKALESRRPKK